MLCSENNSSSSPSQQVNLAAQYHILRRGYAVPYGPKQMGNLTASPKFSITMSSSTIGHVIIISFSFCIYISDELLSVNWKFSSQILSLYVYLLEQELPPVFCPLFYEIKFWQQLPNISISILCYFHENMTSIFPEIGIFFKIIFWHVLYIG